MQKVIKSSQLVADTENIISNIRYDKLFILTDANTHQHCLPLLGNLSMISDAIEIVIPADDINKTIATL